MITQNLLKHFLNEDIFLYKFLNKNGLSVTVTNYGATITSIKVPDKRGSLLDIALGFDNLEDYLKGHPYFGSTIGRYANRIAGGVFSLNGKKYKLECNDGNNHLHGGFNGFDKVVWQSEIKKNKLAMYYLSKDGDQGYPGNLEVCVTFELNNDNELKIQYNAESDSDTIINLTNHTYFNLSGCLRDILDHELKIHANMYTPVSEGGIPNGEIASLNGTPMDFSKMTRIGKNINDKFLQLGICNGYDHNYVLDKPGLCAEVLDPVSGITLDVITDKPGIQFYSGNHLVDIKGRKGVKYVKNFGFCLETQFFPDSPNHSNFSDCVLKKGDIYSYNTTYRFGVL